MTVWLGVALVAFVLIIALLMIKQFFWNPRLKSVKNKHVVVSVSSNLEKFIRINIIQGQIKTS